MSAKIAATDGIETGVVHRRVRSVVLAAALAAAASTTFAGTGRAAGLSQADLQRFSSNLQLTKAQTPQVNAITQELVRENNTIFAKFGIDGRSCSNLGPFQLSALNNETMAAYSRARARLSQILSAEQVRAYNAIYMQRRQETKNRIVCGPRQAQR